MRLDFFVHGAPVGKGRPRFRRQGAFVKTYTPTETQAYEYNVGKEAQAAHANHEPFTRAVSIKMVVVRARPPSVPKKRLHPEVAPDIDNYIKIVLDGLNGSGVWRNDSIVCDVYARKRYVCAAWPQPGIAVTIEDMT